jgi:Uma2 family endonuclease
VATAPLLITLDEYFHTNYRPDAHFVDGVIEERNLGEYDHAKLQTFIAVLFSNNEDRWQTDAVVEQRIRVAPNRVRVADIAILHADAPHEPVTHTPPYICIEVLSPEDRLSRAEKVLSDYLAMGVPNIWLIDPIKRKAYNFSANGLEAVDDLVLTVPETPIRLDVADLFAKLDKKTR